MDERFPLLADQLLLIERELRIQGWWDSVPPSPEALASELPFCVDTLSFEQWLQWIFLPRMTFMLEAGMALPTASGVQAMGEVAFRERLAQAKPLLGLLGEFDNLLEVRP